MVKGSGVHFCMKTVSVVKVLVTVIVVLTENIALLLNLNMDVSGLKRFMI